MRIVVNDLLACDICKQYSQGIESQFHEQLVVEDRDANVHYLLAPKVVANCDNARNWLVKYFIAREGLSSEAADSVAHAL